MEQKTRKSLFERYVANCLGVIARFEKSYDDILLQFERSLRPQDERTAKEIRSDLLKRFNKKES